MCSLNLASQQHNFTQYTQTVGYPGQMKQVFLLIAPVWTTLCVHEFPSLFPSDFRSSDVKWREIGAVCVVLHGLSCTRFMSLLATHSTAVPFLLLLHSSPLFLTCLMSFIHSLFLIKLKSNSHPLYLCLYVNSCKAALCLLCILCFVQFHLFFLLAPASTSARLCVCWYLIHKCIRWEEYFRGCSIIAEILQNKQVKIRSTGGYLERKNWEMCVG